ncbi:hypothetical protein Bca52824_015448 [Brassica carinata]|uniref:Uncharacterized protein n=1 Tax=Brassica carinata TaxID=52824 RepID=A0A8X7W4I1_BRACI|nr:hypothetical protein Bca52824_015448 [Brassica carinata]
MAFGGFGFRFVISDLLPRRSSQSFRVLRGLLVLGLFSFVSLAFPCPLTPAQGFHSLDFGLRFSEITNVEMVLGRVIDRLRVNIWS